MWPSGSKCQLRVALFAQDYVTGTLYPSLAKSTDFREYLSRKNTGLSMSTRRVVLSVSRTQSIAAPLIKILFGLSLG